MKAFVAWCVVLVLASGLILSLLDVQAARQGEQEWRDSARVRGERVTIWQAKYAEAATSVDTVTITVVQRIRQVSDLRDTLRLTDTVAVLRYVERTDAALQACSELADACRLFRVTADSTIGAVSAERDAYRKLYNAAKPSKWDKIKPWVFLAGGFYVGAKLRVK